MTWKTIDDKLNPLKDEATMSIRVLCARHGLNLDEASLGELRTILTRLVSHTVVASRGTFSEIDTREDHDEST